MQILTDLIWKAGAVCTALLAVRIYWLGLVKIYPRVFGYLVWIVLGNFTLMMLQPKTFAYGNMYFLFQTGNVLLAVFVVRELYHNALANRPALAGYARSVAGYVLLGAAVLVGFTATLDKNISHLRSPWLHRYLTFERSMDLMIVLLLLLGGLFLTWFPVKLKRNVLLFCTGFLAFYLARASGLLLANLLAENRIAYINSVLLCISLVCSVFWLFSMRREADDTDTITGIPRSPERLAELTRRLDAINSRLSRFSLR